MLHTHEVTGSSPVVSTKNKRTTSVVLLFLYFFTVACVFEGGDPVIFFEFADEVIAGIEAVVSGHVVDAEMPLYQHFSA